jgi:hypothetical protein
VVIGSTNLERAIVKAMLDPVVNRERVDASAYVKLVQDQSGSLKIKHCNMNIKHSYYKHD